MTQNETSYGTVTYGEPGVLYGETTLNPTVDLNTTSLGFNTLRLDWDRPSGNWQRIRLVRNLFSVPSDENDGQILVDANCGPAATGTIDAPVQTYTDTALPNAQFIYYSLFTFASNQGSATWTRIADGQGLSVQDHDDTNYLASRLPAFLSSPDNGNRMSDFLGVLGTELSHIRDLVRSLFYLNDPYKVSGKALPHLMDQLGFAVEPEIGMRQNRVLASDAIGLHQKKGTGPGVVELASSVSGYGCVPLPMLNLMLDHNDSSADESTGRWVVTNANLQRRTAVSPPGDTTAGSGSWLYAKSSTWGGLNDTWQSAGSSYSAPVSEALANPGVFQITAVAGGSVECDLGSGQPQMFGVPVYGSQQYTFSAYFLSPAQSRLPQLSILWYDKRGGFLSKTDAPGDTINPTSTDGLTWVRNLVTGYAPSTAVFATLRINYPTVVGGEIQYFDGCQFEQGGQASGYRAAREIDIAVVAPRINEVLNPTFRTSTDNWSGNEVGIAWDSASYFPGTTGSCLATLTNHITGDSTSFEGGTLGNFRTGADWTATVISTDAASGTHCLDIVRSNSDTTAAAGRIYTNNWPAAPNSTYRLSVKMKHIAGQTGPYQLFAYDNGPPPVDWVSAPIYLTDEWEEYDLIFTTGASTSSIDIIVDDDNVNTAPTAGNEFYLDDIRLYNLTDQPYVSTTVDLDPGRPIAVQAQVQPQDGSASFCIEVDCYDSSNNLVMTYTSPDQDAPVGTWTNITLSSATATQVVQAPFQGSNAVSQVSHATVKVCKTLGAINGYGSGPYGSDSYDGFCDSFLLDNVLVEQQSYPGPYFDVTTNPSEVYWEAGNDNSRSHFYPGSPGRLQRALALVSDNIPLGSDAAFVTAVPRAAYNTWIALYGVTWSAVSADTWGGPYGIQSVASSEIWAQLGAWDTLNTWNNP